MADVTVTREIAAPPDEVWALVSDLPRMGEWSPENEGGEWVGGATGPTAGAKFRGSNRHGSKRWKTMATIVDADPGRRLSFRVTAFGLKVADWAYDIEPTATGCLVTESWTDLRPGFFKPIAKLATGVEDRLEHTRPAMEATLDALAATATAGD
jgi:uncharacterized protein YndB with AHSA1/START domain